MKAGNNLIISAKRTVTSIVVLLVFLSAGVVQAGNANADLWAKAQIDSIAVLLTDRQNEEAVDFSRAFVDSLESRNAQGADLAKGLEVLARSLRRNREFREPETLELARQAVASCSGSPVADANLKASCLNTLGLILFQRAENEEALPLFVEATELWSTERGPDDQKVGTGYNNQGLVREALGEDQEARLALENAARIYEIWQDDPQYLIKFARTTMTIARLNIKLGHYEQARLRGEQCVEIYRSAPGGKHLGLGSAMGDLAALYRTMGDWDRSETLYEKAIPLLETAYGPDHREVGRILNNLGNLRADQGDIATARSCFERALAITEKTLGSDNPQTGVRLLNLGSIMADLGDFELAKAYLLRSEEIFQARLGGDHLYMGYAKQGLGSVLAAKGEFSAGLSRLLEAQIIFESQLGPSHVAVAQVLGNIGDAFLELGRYPEANQALVRAVTIVQAELGPEHPEAAYLLHSQGQLALKKSDATGAADLLAEALLIGTKAFGQGHPDLAEIHLDLAYALTDLDQLPEAFDHALLAEQIGRTHFELAASAFEERRALQYAQQRPSGLGLATTLALRMEKSEDPRVAESLWEELVRSRGLVLDLMGTRQQFQHHSVSSRSLVDSLGFATGELANLFVRGVGEDSPADYRAALTEARAKRENLELRLAVTSLGFARQMVVAKAGFTEVAEDLKKDEALVSFLTYSTRIEDDAAVAALVFRSGVSEPQLYHLGTAGKIENAVIAWRQTVIAGLMADGDQLETVTADCMQAGRSLAAMIWDPLGLDQVQGKVFIVPDGAISFVDFQALPRVEGGFLVENDAVLALVSSERDLLSRPNSDEHGEGLLIMGGMKFGSPVESSDELVDCGDYKNLHFDQLPGTKHEAQTVADLWSEFDGGPVRRFLGDEAQEDAFKSSASDFEVVHLATHGFFLGRECRDPAARTRGVGGAYSKPPSLNHGDLVNPLLWAGLAFSGANDKSREVFAEDGILTAYEVASLDLSGVEVAILSACDTGQGDLLDGEGVFGLQRAFAKAGARSLIMSLGPVDDGVAAKWMEQLYRMHLLEGLDFSQAARQASLIMLHEQRAKGWPEHPFTWSPFVKIRTGS